MIPILILSPSPALRAGLRALLGVEADLEIVGTASSLSELEEVPEARVIVAAPGTLGESLRPEWAVLLVGEEAEEAQSIAEAGISAWGVLSPDAPAEALGAAVRALNQGLVVGSPELLLQVYEKHVEGTIEPPAPTGERLTPREVEVLLAISEGLTNKQIAARLGVSEHTVKFHVSSIYSKLGVSNRAEATRTGAKQGYLAI